MPGWGCAAFLESVYISPYVQQIGANVVTQCLLARCMAPIEIFPLAVPTFTSRSFKVSLACSAALALSSSAEDRTKTATPSMVGGEPSKGEIVVSEWKPTVSM
jgi:hypothetical protein